MALGSRTCRVMYFYLPTLAPKRPARSKRNRLLFIRGTADHARANKSKSTKGTVGASLVADVVKSGPKKKHLYE